MYLRRREISPTVTQDLLRDNATIVPLARYAKSCTPPSSLTVSNLYSTGPRLSVPARSRSLRPPTWPRSEASRPAPARILHHSAARRSWIETPDCARPEDSPPGKRNLETSPAPRAAKVHSSAPESRPTRPAP